MDFPAGTPLSARITFSPVRVEDFDELVELRIATMRESLERVGRFDPVRARERLKKSFFPEQTEFIRLDDRKIGFYTLRPIAEGLRLEHLYVHPDNQSRGDWLAGPKPPACRRGQKPVAGTSGRP